MRGVNQAAPPEPGARIGAGIEQDVGVQHAGAERERDGWLIGSAERCQVGRQIHIIGAVEGGETGEAKLRRHIGYALNVGLSRREICETFSQAGWYRGWPYVEDALTEAKKVFAERGI